ncbi:phosphotransferase system eiib component type 2/3 [Lucifera butyrica]|uniref:Phosphotransferase system eiib component type 2/3 n=1 Tax=Lucifera butyrica TaxID=1351585 RepID=A0A498R7F5_9FIRM|nr:PRD domain-containing protein [Lucifera butyrica]VBB07149.1 phosphotransferase system eiib component type 2/3 [Lucifera butyrica]
MKELQHRQKQILKYLLQMDDFEPVKNIAAALQCSIKTIRNDLAVIEESGVSLERISGRGVRLLPSGRNAIGNRIEENNVLYDLSVEDRRMKILFELFEGTKEKLSIQYLAGKYFVSKTSIVNDFKVIEEKLAKYNLQLRKSIQGTYLTGSETDIRKAMVDMLNTLIGSKSMPLQVENTRIDKETILELEEHFGEFNVSQVKTVIEKAETLLHYRITEPYYINLITHLLILIQRTKQGKTIYSQTKVEKMEDPSFYRVSQKMARWLENALAIKINKEEVFYIYRYLMSSGGVIVQESYADKLNEVDDFLHRMAKEMIDLSAQISQFNFLFTPLLFNSLLLHLKPMINRIEYNIEIKNPLLNEIKEEFPEVMLLLRLVILKIRVRYNLPPISEDEISYIAVYFQSAIEESIDRQNVMIICSTGVGTSHLLAKRVKNQFPEWKIVDIVSAKEMERKTDWEDIDLVLSTVKLTKPVNKPVAYVSALFNKADVSRIRESLLPGYQPVTERIEEDPEISLATDGRYLDSTQAQCWERIVLNNAELCIYSKPAGQQENRPVILKNMDGGKKKVTVILGGEADLSEDLLKRVYHFVIKTEHK